MYVRPSTYDPRLRDIELYAGHFGGKFYRRSKLEEEEDENMPGKTK